MNQNSSIIAQNDSLVSRIIKHRDPFCKLRLKDCQGKTNDPAHCFGRSNMATRWDLQCVYGACRSCHSFVDTHPELKHVYFVGIMGPEVYETKRLLSNQIVRHLPSDLKAIHKILTLSIKQYE